MSEKKPLTMLIGNLDKSLKRRTDGGQTFAEALRAEIEENVSLVLAKLSIEELHQQKKNYTVQIDRYLARISFEETKKVLEDFSAEEQEAMMWVTILTDVRDAVEKTIAQKSTVAMRNLK